LRSAPDCRPRRALLHLSYSCVSPYGPAILATHGQQRNWKGVDPTVLIPGILSKIRPRNCPNQSYVHRITDSAPRQASVAESSVALPPVSVESRHAVPHALNPRHRMPPASTGQHAGPNMPLLRRHHAAPPDDSKTWSAFGTVHLRLPFLRTGRNKGSSLGTRHETASLWWVA
jgi:hypothetical protein